MARATSFVIRPGFLLVLSFCPFSIVFLCFLSGDGADWTVRRVEVMSKWARCCREKVRQRGGRSVNPNGLHIDLAVVRAMRAPYPGTGTKQFSHFYNSLAFWLICFSIGARSTRAMVTIITRYWTQINTNAY